MDKVHLKQLAHAPVHKWRRPKAPAPRQAQEVNLDEKVQYCIVLLLY